MGISLAAVALALALISPAPVPDTGTFDGVPLFPPSAPLDPGFGTSDGPLLPVVPTVSVAPTCGDGDQDPLTISGTKAPTGYHVAIEIDGQSFLGSTVIAPQADGSWQATGTVNGLADGQRTISTVFYFPHTGEIGPPDIPGPSTTYQVPCPPPPTVSVAPTCGDGDQDSLTISGTRAPTGKTVRVFIDGEPFPTDSLFAVPQADGSWELTGIADGLMDGQRTISTAFHTAAPPEFPVPDVPGASTTYQVPCPPVPTVSVAPSCGDGDEDTLLVSGTGAPSGYRVEVSIDDESFGPADGIVPADDGTWTATGTVDSLGVGEHEIGTSFYVPSFDSSAPGDIPGPSTTYRVPCPTLTVDPASVAWRPGPVDLELSGAGFGAWSHVDFTVSGKPPTDTADVTETGEFSLTVTLSALPGCGIHQVVATQEQDSLLPALPSPPPTATAPLTVTCPALTVVPGTIAAASLPRPLTWTLTGFDPRAPVALRIADQPIGVVLTDGSGSGSSALPAGKLPCGPLQATARQVGPGAVPTASAALLVTCTTPPPASVVPATLTVGPAIVAAGTPTLATGTGFTPGRTVRLTWLLPDATSAPGVMTVVVGSKGSFRVMCLVFAHSRLGPRELVAAETAGPNIRAASASLLVVPGSLQPGRHGLVTRR